MKYQHIKLLGFLSLVLSTLCDFQDSEGLDLPSSFAWNTNLTYGFKFRADRTRFRTDRGTPMDFDKTGCVRLDRPPSPMPQQFTVCMQYKYEFFPADLGTDMIFISFENTLYGDSVVEAFAKNLTYSQVIRDQWPHQHKIMHHIWSFQSLFTGQFHETWSWARGQIANTVVDYQKWYSVCHSVSIPDGSKVVYWEGEKVAESSGSDREEWLEREMYKYFNKSDSFDSEWSVHNQSYPNETVNDPRGLTDIFIGCDLTAGPGWLTSSFGTITNLHMWDRVLTEDELKDLSTCGGQKKRNMVGNFIDWNTANWTVYGKDVAWKVRLSDQEICPTHNYFSVAIPLHVTHMQARKMCSKIKNQLINYNTENEEIVKSWLYTWQHHFRFRGGDSDSFWEHTGFEWNYEKCNYFSIYTGEQMPDTADWVSAKPCNAENCINFIHKYGEIQLRQFPCDRIWDKALATCIKKSKDMRIYDPFRVHIDGLCKDTLFDTEYAMINVASTTGGYHDSQFIYMGKFSSTITLDRGGGRWVMKGKTGGAIAYIVASPDSMALGTHSVVFENDECTKKLSNKELKITLTHCTLEEFPCRDGFCVPMEKRCNGVINCGDKSDELDCETVIIDSTYISDYPPLSENEKDEIIKADVEISVDILSILSISEKDSIFEVSFILNQRWFDGRLVYHNLKNDSDINTITSKEKEAIWRPKLEFSNTKSKEDMVLDQKVFTKIIQMGNHTRSDITVAESAYIFKGEDNPILLSRIYDIRFICEYDMSWYPFDIQTCKMKIQTQGNTGIYVTLIPEQLVFSGSKEMSMYFVIGFEMVSLSGNRLSGVTVIVMLGRRLLSVILTVYLPTILLNIIGHITHYFKPFYFESAIAVNLTVMLVLTSMFIAVGESMPETSYIKMVEIWLIFNLLIPFLDVLLHCKIDNLRSELTEERTINHHGEPRQVPTEMTAVETDQIPTSFNKDLISVNEVVQDAARKDYYNKLKLGQQQKKIDRYLFIAHQVNPTVASWFVVCYWTAGMLNYFMFSSEVVTNIIILTTIIFLFAFVFNYCLSQKKRKSRTTVVKQLTQK